MHTYQERTLPYTIILWTLVPWRLPRNDCSTSPAASCVPGRAHRLFLSSIGIIAFVNADRGYPTPGGRPAAGEGFQASGEQKRVTRKKLPAAAAHRTLVTSPHQMEIDEGEGSPEARKRGCWLMERKARCKITSALELTESGMHRLTGMLVPQMLVIRPSWYFDFTQIIDLIWTDLEWLQKPLQYICKALFAAFSWRTSPPTGPLPRATASNSSHRRNWRHILWMPSQTTSSWAHPVTRWWFCGNGSWPRFAPFASR